MNDCALLYVVYSDPIRSHEEAVYVVNNSRKSVSQLFLHLLKSCFSPSSHYCLRDGKQSDRWPGLSQRNRDLHDDHRPRSDTGDRRLRWLYFSQYY